MENSYAKSARGLSIVIVVLSGLAILGTVIALAFGALAFSFAGDAAGYLRDNPAILDEAIREAAEESNVTPEELRAAVNRALSESGLQQGDIIDAIIGAAEDAGVSPKGIHELQEELSDPDEAFALLAFGLGMVMLFAFGFFLLVAAAVSLVAGILGIKRSRTPERLGAAFGWGIASAIMCFLSARFISMVLQIIAVVEISRARKFADQQQMPYGAPYAPAMSPAQGVSQPAYGYAPVAPDAPVNTMQNAPMQNVPVQSAQQPAQPAQPAQVQPDASAGQVEVLSVEPNVPGQPEPPVQPAAEQPEPQKQQAPGGVSATIDE